MTLCEVYLCAKGLFENLSLERGLLLVARLGRYGHAEEREAALLLDVYRSGALGPRAKSILALTPDAEVILSALESNKRQCQLEQVLESGNISAARVLLCDCYTDKDRPLAERRQSKQVADHLLRWLPREATESLRCGSLTEADVKSLFAPRQAEVNYL